MPGSRHGRSVDTGKGTGHVRLFGGGILIVGMPWCPKGDARRKDEARKKAMRFEIMGGRFAGGVRGDNLTLLRVGEVA